VSFHFLSNCTLLKSNPLVAVVHIICVYEEALFRVISRQIFLYSGVVPLVRSSSR